MPPKMPFDTLNLQHQVRRNAEEVQNVIADLGSWEDDIKNRDKKLIKGDLNPTYAKMKQVPPVRKKGFAEMVPSGMPGPKDKEREKEKMNGGEDRIQPKSYADYNQWDKFVNRNLDKMLEDFDEQDRQEQEDKHRQRMLEERRAIEEKEAVARKNVEDGEALKVLGNALLKTGDLEGALAKYCEAVALDPGNFVAWANAAHVRLELGQLKEAVEDCGKALEREPRYVKALLRRSAALARLPAPNMPEVEFMAAEEFSGCKLGYVFKQDSLGLGYYVDTKAPNENVERAKNDLRQVLRLEPNNAQAQAALDKLAPKILSPQEEAEKKEKAEEIERRRAEAEAEEARRQKEEEKQRRRAQRAAAGGKKLAIRQVDGDDEGLIKQMHVSEASIKQMHVSSCTQSSGSSVGIEARGEEGRLHAPALGAEEGGGAGRVGAGERGGGGALVEEVTEASQRKIQRPKQMQTTGAAGVGGGEAGGGDGGGEPVGKGEGKVQGPGEEEAGKAGENSRQDRGFVSMADAREVAAAAKKAVEEKLSDLDLEIPKTSVEFSRTWKRVRANPKKLQSFLARIPPKNLPTLFRAELPEDVFISLLENLDEEFVPSDPKGALAFLEGLSTVKGLPMLLRFLGKKEKELVGRVLQRLRSTLGDQESEVHQNSEGESNRGISTLDRLDALVAVFS